MTMLRTKKGFTLIEVIVSLILSAIVVFFVYTMMTASYTAYRKLFGVSQFGNDVRFFETSMAKSVKNAAYVSLSNTQFIFGYYDVDLSEYRLDIYSFDSGNFTNDLTNALNPPSKTEDIPQHSRVLKLSVYTLASSNYASAARTLKRTEILLQDVNAVYYYQTITGIMSNIKLGLIYHKVLADGEVNYEIRTFMFTARGYLLN